MRGIAGMVMLLLIAWLMSENRRIVPWRIVLAGIGLQVVIAILMTKAAPFRIIFMGLNGFVSAMEKATRAGTSFVFGYVGGARPPFAEINPADSFSLAFQALPMVLVIGALTTLLYYWRILPKIVQGFSWVLRKSMGIGGALGVASAGNIFLGMVETPLLIRPYLNRMTRSELFALMATGLSCIAGTILVVYATILQKVIPDSLGHILTASIIHAPAALVIAAIMIPETGKQTLGGEIGLIEARGVMDALVKGTGEALNLLLNIVAVLIVFVALIKLLDIALGYLPNVMGEALTLERILGILMAPVVWMIGVPWNDAGTAGSLMGVKIVLNELIAYLQLAALPPTALEIKSRIILTYAMCSFANFGSLGILVGGLGAMCPERRDEIVGMGIKSLVAGVLASMMTGAIVGVL